MSCAHCSEGALLIPGDVCTPTLLLWRPHVCSCAPPVVSPPVFLQLRTPTRAGTPRTGTGVVRSAARLPILWLIACNVSQFKVTLGSLVCHLIHLEEEEEDAYSCEELPVSDCAMLYETIRTKVIQSSKTFDNEFDQLWLLEINGLFLWSNTQKQKTKLSLVLTVSSVLVQWKPKQRKRIVIGWVVKNDMWSYVYNGTNIQHFKLTNMNQLLCICGEKTHTNLI